MYLAFFRAKATAKNLLISHLLFNIFLNFPKIGSLK